MRTALSFIVVLPFLVCGLAQADNGYYEVQTPDQYWDQYWYEADPELEYGARIGNRADDPCPVEHRRIFLSEKTGNDDNPGSQELPLQTLDGAKELADLEKAPGYCIYLKGGETFTKFTRHSGASYIDDGEGLRNNFAFIWDNRVPLVMTSYGGGTATLSQTRPAGSSELPPKVIAVVNCPGVVIQNLRFVNWQTGAINFQDADNIIVRQNHFENVGTKFFKDKKNEELYAAGVVYPKDCDKMLVTENVFKNIHNITKNVDQLHVFYPTRTSNLTISNNKITNASGPPFKLNKNTYLVLIEKNEVYYAGPTSDMKVDQKGFFRWSRNKDCPSRITVKENILKYPYCSGSSSSCKKKKALLESDNDCESTYKEVDWIDNDIDLKWKKTRID